MMVSIVLFLWNRNDRWFLHTFLFHGALYFVIAIWEHDIWDPVEVCTSQGWWWHYGFWWVMYSVIIPLMFITMFLMANNWKPKKEKLFWYGALLCGNWWFFGPLEDFMCYVFWGLDKFHEYKYVFHNTFLFGIPMPIIP